MELPDIPFNKAEYIETASGNRVSRASVLCGSQNIILNGKNIVQSEAIIRGDLANVRVGRHCVISSKAVSTKFFFGQHITIILFQVIRPPFKKFSKGVAFFPLQVQILFIARVLPTFNCQKPLHYDLVWFRLETMSSLARGVLSMQQWLIPMFTLVG